MTQNENYLGKKGYSIPKDNITLHEQQFIRRELSVRPFIPNSPVPCEEFPIYRESPKKLYLPRYFGNKNYGEATIYNISLGKDINLDFKGTLWDYQINIVQKYMTATEKGTGGGLLDIGCGKGKTVLALNIISQLKKKTLVIVHKSFLMQQWKERIQQFLPNARIGRIQGQVIDIEDKDIVLGMLQSLSMKSYPQEVFDEFGFMIVDECHHISAEVFVRSLLKIVTNYTLGLSATMNRKDGLTKVFKMFLGDIVHSEKRETNTSVEVRMIKYIASDEEFNREEHDWRGNPKYSTMISKLCSFNHRSEFILKVLEGLLKENSEQQIMILGHNKNLLVYFYKAIEHRNICTVGYYIGGMKDAALKESETKKVIIATYAMASEALDIKTLTTLIMATPKTDVIQAVGRILRTKHTKPIVVDIVDNHDLFQRQWKKRRVFYMKQNYKIIGISNIIWSSQKWETIYEPGEKAAKCAKKIKEKEEPLLGKCLIQL